jgi:hypothetical protein
MALYVDNIYTNGDDTALEDVIIGLRKRFKINVVNDLTDYLSCEICFNKGKTEAWLVQPHLLKNLEQKLGDLAKSNQTFKTPEMPGKGVICPQEGERRIPTKQHSLYCSGVVMLLY